MTKMKTIRRSRRPEPSSVPHTFLLWSSGAKRSASQLRCVDTRGNVQGSVRTDASYLCVATNTDFAFRAPAGWESLQVNLHKEDVMAKLVPYHILFGQHQQFER